MISFNAQIFSFALQSLLRFFSKNLFITIIYTILVMLLATLFILQSSIKAKVDQKTDLLPDIVLVNQKAMQDTTINSKGLEKIYEIYGVSDVVARVYGKYEFKQADLVFNIIGVDPFEIQKEPFAAELLKDGALSQGHMYLSKPLKKIFALHYYEHYFNFLKPSLESKQIEFLSSFESPSIDKRYLCVMEKSDAKEVFGYGDDEFSDIAIYLSNQNELLQVVAKLQQLYPNAKIITKEDEQTKVELLFDYDSGVFISLFIISIFTFFMIIFDKTNAMSSAEKKEIGILKALGWRVEDVLRAKLYEAGIISLFSYLLGLVLAFLYLVLFDGYYIRDIFLNIIGVKEIAALDIVVNFQALAIVFFLSVPIYIAATLVPAWRVAVRDADEVMR
ncbi:MAG: FtsX-like permease family protein [Sulfurimonas sp.]